MAENNTQALPSAIYLKDYRHSPYIIETVDLRFKFHQNCCEIESRLAVIQNPATEGHPDLVLDGEELELCSLSLDDRPLSAADYRRTATTLTVFNVPERFQLTVITRVDPEKNTALSGLYQSGGIYCTQCEPEGFRRMTYYIDRPDVMARFTTTLVADRARFPVLLANGNLVQTGQGEDGTHYAVWVDPFPKPSYLFALVAGDLAHIQGEFVTRSGRRIELFIYVEEHNIDQCAFALESLRRAMRWDEQAYGREYDLERYMIVAVDDFNMGAMENKGLNIFNSKYVLAKAETATDQDYQNIEGVIGHEYFHNWSGNRVTCRDWFQLSLKEGFTVFRDQEFSADMQSRGVKRIQDVNMLRTHQFREDAGPMAHAVRPDSYVEINNFYTATVYEKGAEVIRMIHNLLGAEGFHKGCDRYFARHDGQAVTTEDFVKAMEEATGYDLSQFRLWYSQAGTPVLTARSEYLPEQGAYRLTIKQSSPPTPGQPEKQPMQVPVAMGLLGRDGQELSLRLKGETHPVHGTRVLALTRAEEVFEFIDLPQRPIPSLLRGFSAPVKLDIDLADEQLSFLMAHDTDDFNRWDAGQQLSVRILLRLVDDIQAGRALQLDPAYLQAWGQLVSTESRDQAMLAQALTLPGETYLSEFMTVIDPLAIHQARLFVRRRLAHHLKDAWRTLYQANRDSGPYQINPSAIGRRALKNCALGYLMELEDDRAISHCQAQYHQANNMTDVLAALAALVNTRTDLAEPALAEFYKKWAKESLVVDKWFSIQASSRLPGALARVRGLTQHPAFKLTNPNKVRSVLGVFCSANPAQFHQPDGAGYAFLADQVLLLNEINPQIASRLVNPLIMWRKYDQERQRGMKAQLERILTTPGISKDVYEVVSKGLA